MSIQNNEHNNATSWITEKIQINLDNAINNDTNFLVKIGKKELYKNESILCRDVLNKGFSC
jgi:hypothetical protein